MMNRFYREPNGHRPGAMDFSRSAKIMSLASAAWVIIVAAAWVIWVAGNAAAGLI